MANWTIDYVLSANNYFTLFADVVCHIHVFINEALVWEKNRSEDKSSLDLHRLWLYSKRAHARTRTHVTRTEYGREVMLCTSQTNKQTNWPSYIE